LAAAIAGLGLPTNPYEARTRAARVSGRDPSRRLVRLGRLLGTDAPDEDVAAVLESSGGDEAAQAIGLELAARARRYDELSAKISSWAETSEGQQATRDRQLAAALVAERAGHRQLAVDGYTAALIADGTGEPAARAAG